MTKKIDLNSTEIPHAAFGARLDALLKSKGLNGSDCARHLDCTPQAVSKWRAGKQLPRGDQIDVLAAFLGTTPSYLRFGGDAVVLTPPGPEFVLMWVEATAEVPLLNEFREGSERGQKQLLAAAKRMEKRSPSDLPPPPPLPKR